MYPLCKKGCWILSIFFLHLLKLSWFLSFILFMWYIILTDLHRLNYPLILVLYHTWSLHMTLLMCCWIQFSGILFTIFACILIWDIDLQFSFLVVLSCFGIRVMLFSWNGYESVSCTAIFRRILQIGINNSLSVW